MGYAVRWSGTDLVEALREDSSDILGRPFAMYIVALATEVDLDALDWLRQYGRAVDSLTGADVAFLTFCNSTLNHVIAVDKRISRRSYIDLVDAESTATLYHAGLTKPAVIDIKAGDGDGALLRKYRQQATREAFVRSMTYESDSFARSLGLGLAELPCLVFFDDPGSPHYYVMPMNQAPDQLMHRLRIIIGSYYQDAGGSEFINCLSQWRAVRDSLAADSASTMIRELGQRREEFATAFSPEPSLDPTGIFIDRLAVMREKLAELRSQRPDTTAISQLAGALDNAWDKLADLHVLPRMQRLRDFVAPIRASIENETLSPDDARQLQKLYKRLSKHLDPETPVPATGQDWLHALDLAMSGDLAERCEDAKNRLAAVQSALPAGSADIIAPFDWQIGSVRQRQQEGEDEQARLSELLRTLPRPSLEPTIKGLRWADRRERTRRLTSAAMETVARDPSFLLRVLTLFGIGAGG